ncbi:chemotaxis protein CheX [Bacillus spongiae]|uniref:Chemotaxis protein CheX n=1 Tax=Bacillus spongiae TaxID=2683610 RepID=A0ABU8HD15_9BACI
MTSSNSIHKVLNSSIEAIRAVIPISLKVDKPSLLQHPIFQHRFGVLIGITGDVRGKVIVESQHDTLKGIGTAMFGIPVEGEMLESFAGELGNMIAGNLSTNIANKGLTTDITPPTVIVGQSKLYGFEQAILLPIHIVSLGELQIIFMLEQPQKKRENSFQ